MSDQAQAEGTKAATTEQIITVTPQAIEKINGLLEEKKLEGHCLRVFVVSGGCSGLQYGMAFEPQPREEDTVVNANGLQVLVDPFSLQYMSGSTVDYVETEAMAGFRIDNPNYTPSCSCSGGGCG
ncbi:MAG: iron-sulfur cluster assembly accessory protein [Anaerolineae bacterium]|nr:iron-sulfur cluster assembly accessory protein [Anaerolineae bacterium]